MFSTIYQVSGKVDGVLWGNTQLGVHQPTVGPPGSQHSGQTAFTTLVPVTQDSTQQLAEQMEQSLSIRGGNQQLDSDAGMGQQTEKQSTGQKGSQVSVVGQKVHQHPSTISQVSTSVIPGGGHNGANGNGTRTLIGGATNGAFHGMYPMMAGIPVDHTGGQMVSPTQVGGPIQIIPPQMQPQIIPVSQEHHMIANQHLTPTHPSSLVQYPSPIPQGQNVNQPTTPPVGPLSLPPPSLMSAQQHQGIFSPTTTGVTHSPVQILGHTLGTSLFSPPPSSTAPHGVFVNSPSATGKIVGFAPGTPAHPPVGSGPRFRRYDSPKQLGHMGNSITSQSPGTLQMQLSQESPIAQQKPFPKPTANGASPIPTNSNFQPLQLPPRLAQQQQQQQQQQQRNVGTRYQNQRHPANRNSSAVKVGSGVTLGDHMPTHLTPSQASASPTILKREPLLPTPPSTQMVKLDTTLTCKSLRLTVFCCVCVCAYYALVRRVLYVR